MEDTEVLEVPVDSPVELAEAELAEADLLEDDLLVEEISIDGMCGVY